MKSAGIPILHLCFFAPAGRSSTFPPLLRLTPQKKKKKKSSFAFILSVQSSSGAANLKRRNFLPARLPPSLSLSSKLRRAAWRCVTSLVPPANPVIAAISPRQHPPPLPSFLLHLSLCGWMMS